MLQLHIPNGDSEGFSQHLFLRHGEKERMTWSCLFLGSVQLSQLFNYLTQVKRNEVMVEEGYFFPVLTSYFPVYVYSFINGIQAVQKSYSSFNSRGEKNKSEVVWLQALVYDGGYGTLPKKKACYHVCSKVHFSDVQEYGQIKVWNFTNEAEQERTESYNPSSQYHGTFSRRLGKESPCTPEATQNTECNPQNYL